MLTTLKIGVRFSQHKVTTITIQTIVVPNNFCLLISLLLSKLNHKKNGY